MLRSLYSEHLKNLDPKAYRQLLKHRLIRVDLRSLPHKIRLFGFGKLGPLCDLPPEEGNMCDQNMV